MPIPPFGSAPSKPAIGKAIVSGTSGSVLFVDSSGNLAQDNANLFWDATNKQLRIDAPSAPSTLSSVPTNWAAPSSFRNDVSLSVGVVFTLLEPITVTQLGRYYRAGNTQDHVLNLWDSTNTLTPVATATVLHGTASDSYGIKYVSLGAPVTLVAGHTYYLSSDETNGGDSWADTWNAPFTVELFNAIAAFGPASSFESGTTAGTSLGYLSMKFTAGVSFGSISVAGATASSDGYGVSVRDSNNRVYALARNDGIQFFGMPNTPNAHARVQIASNDPAAIPLLIQSGGSQTADLIQFQNVLGSVLAKLDSTGNMWTNQNASAGVYVGALPSDPNNYGGMWLATSSPNSTNYALLSGLGEVLLNATTDVGLRISNAPILTVTASQVTISQNASLSNKNLSDVGAVFADFVADKSNSVAFVQTATDSTHGWTVFTRSASKVPFSVQAASSQSANIQEWQKSDGSVYSAVNATGDFVLSATSGAPADAPAARTCRYDVSANKLWVYNGSAWKSVLLT